MPEQPCDNPFIVEFIGRHSLRRAEDGWVWKFESEAMGSRRFREPVREYLQAVGCRAALIFGEKSALVSRETASYMSSLFMISALSNRCRRRSSPRAPTAPPGTGASMAARMPVSRA